MQKRKQDSSTATYVIIALILGLITYIEFAIVEYDFAWLSSGWVMFWLALLSVIKFILVIMFFMHLKEDDKVYTGFFSSGMLLALGSFIGLIFLFTAASVSDFTFTNASQEHIAEAGQALNQPDPKNQAAQITPPATTGEGFAVGPETAAPAAGAPAESPAGGAAVLASFDRAAAAAVYATNCASCHQAEGQGIQGAFPPLAGHAAEIHNAEGGRELLIDTVLFGLIGEIQVNGVTYNGLMPAWPQLDDEQIAGVVNHISTAWGNEALLTAGFTPVAAEEVAEQRGRNLSSGDVHEMRSELDLGAAAVEAPAETEPEAAEETAEAPVEEAAAAPAAPAAAAATADFDRESGAAVFASSCASCHQAEGQGIAGVFPPLADHVPELHNTEGGREYLIHAVLFGLQGPISVLGTDYNGSMPAWPQLTDQRIADVVDHIATAWGNEAQLENFVPVTAEEVAAERGKQLSPADVHEEREALGSTAAETAETAAGEPAAETAEAEAVTAVTPSVDFNRENGERIYATNCAACHQAQGQGIPGAFPPLAGHAASIYNAEGGREVLIHTVLFGLQGQITADGMTYNGMMPAWPQLGDEDIANVVDHIVTAWGNEELLESFTPVTGDEIAAARGLQLSPAQVQEERAALTLQ